MSDTVEDFELEFSPPISERTDADLVELRLLYQSENSKYVVSARPYFALIALKAFTNEVLRLRESLKNATS